MRAQPQACAPVPEGGCLRQLTHSRAASISCCAQAKQADLRASPIQWRCASVLVLCCWPELSRASSPLLTVGSLQLAACSSRKATRGGALAPVSTCVFVGSSRRRHRRRRRHRSSLQIESYARPTAAWGLLSHLANGRTGERALSEGAQSAPSGRNNCRRPIGRNWFAWLAIAAKYCQVAPRDHRL